MSRKLTSWRKLFSPGLVSWYSLLEDQRNTREERDRGWTTAAWAEVSVCSWGTAPGAGTGWEQVAQVIGASVSFS